MDTQTASTILTAITAGAAVIWIVGLQFLLASRQRKPAQCAEIFSCDEPADARTDALFGSAEIEGDTAELASTVAAVLANDERFGPIKIVEASDNCVIFERPVAGGCRPRRCTLTFRAAPAGRCRVEWNVDLSVARLLLRAGFLVQALGLVAIVVGFWALKTYVVASPSPAIRAQAVQMVQVIHFLWPPFLLGALYRGAARGLSSRLEALVSNLPYYSR